MMAYIYHAWSSIPCNVPCNVPPPTNSPLQRASSYQRRALRALVARLKQWYMQAKSDTPRVNFPGWRPPHGLDNRATLALSGHYDNLRLPWRSAQSAVKPLKGVVLLFSALLVLGFVFRDFFCCVCEFGNGEDGRAMTTRITPGVGANLLGQHAAERNQDATAYVGNLDSQVLLFLKLCFVCKHFRLMLWLTF